MKVISDSSTFSSTLKSFVKSVLVFILTASIVLTTLLTANTAAAQETPAHNSTPRALKNKHDSDLDSNRAPKALSSSNSSSSNSSDSSFTHPFSSNVHYVDGSSNVFSRINNIGDFARNSINARSHSALNKRSSNILDDILTNSAKDIADKMLNNNLLRSAQYASAQDSSAQNISLRDSVKPSYRSSNNDSRFGNKREFRPGCYADKARTECFTAPGDLQGHRASSGHDYDMDVQNAWHITSRWNVPKGNYENNNNFTPYPKGTYLMRSMDGLIHGTYNGSWVGAKGQSPNTLPVDEVHDYVFMRKEPKPDGSGYIWDVLFNMGARIHGAADAWNYFTVPDTQKLDVSKKDPVTGEYNQYIRRYQFNDKSIKGCKADWVNPNGFCANVETRSISDGQTLENEWSSFAKRDKGFFLGRDSYTGVYKGGAQTRSNINFASCSGEYGFDCVNSTRWGALNDFQRTNGPQIPNFDVPGINNAYALLINNLKNSVRDRSSLIFAFYNNVYSNTRIPYGYHIHFTTSNVTNSENKNPFYGAGSYFGNRYNSGQASPADPYNKTNLNVRGIRRYRMLNNQWYGVSNIIDMFMTKYSFLRGTGTGPFNSDNGQELAKNGLRVRSLLLNPIEQKVCSEYHNTDCPTDSNIHARTELSITPAIGKNGGNKRGNLWWRNNQGLDKVNTEDSAFGDQSANLEYFNNKLQMGQSVPVPYQIIGQSDVFKPLETQEWQPNQVDKYYSTSKEFKAFDFVNFPDKKSIIYKQAKARFPRLWMPDPNKKDYGSVKNNYYPLSEKFKDNNGAVNNDIKTRAIYDVSWAKEDGSVASKTLRDAVAKIAVRLPVVDAYNACNHDRKSKNTRNSNSNNNGNSSNLCSSYPVEGTERYIWRFYDVPSNSKRIGDDLTEVEKSRFLQRAKNDYVDSVSNGIVRYKTFERKGDHNVEYMMLQRGGENSIQVLPMVVGVKYAKIIYYDDSKALMPVVFTRIDDEKPTIDVKVSIDNGSAQSVPEKGLNVPFGSNIKFFVQGHDDRHVSLGVKKQNGRIGSKYDDIAELNKAFTTISFSSDFDQTNHKNTRTDQSGYINTTPANATLGLADVGKTPEFTFHAWDDAGNEVSKTIKLKVTRDGFDKPTVWWQKQDNGHYDGKVRLLPSAKSVKMVFVRIWKRGDKKPVDDSGNKYSAINTKCPTSGFCNGIILTKNDVPDAKGKLWKQVNNDGNPFFKNMIAPLSGISFEEKNGGLEITIPENLAEIGSRIYVDIANGSSTGSLTQDGTKSDPLPLEIKWPNGLVQANPYELNPSERHALVQRIRLANERLKWRGDEIGFVNDGKNNGYTDGKNDPNGKYSCNQDSDKQYKICLTLNPYGKNNADGKSTEKQLTAIKKTGTGADTSDDQTLTTVLDPKQKKITRFVDIRRDYDWKWSSNKLQDRNMDPGFEMRGSAEQGNQYFVYRWNINSANNQNVHLNKALDLLQGKPKGVDANNPQPSIRPLGNNLGQEAILKTNVERDNGGYGSLPNRGDGKGYKLKNGEWVNIADLVRLVDLGGGQRVSPDEPITSKDYSVQKQSYLIAGGEGYNDRIAGEDVNISLDKKKHYSGIVSKTKDNKYIQYPFESQIYVVNGEINKDLEIRGEGDKNNTRNVINVIFVPVDLNKPTISPKSNKTWLGKCNGSSCANPVTLDEDGKDFKNSNGLFNIAELLKFDDDFNKSNGENNDVLKRTLSIYVEAEGLKDSNNKPIRAQFVKNGVVKNNLLMQFIQKYRGKNAATATTFKLIAQIEDESGNKSDETAVGCFKIKWQPAVAPKVIAYDGNHENRVSGENVWLHDSASAVTDSNNNYNNSVVVKTDPSASRTAIYYNTLDDLKPNAKVKQFGHVFAICKSAGGKNNGSWKVCEGYESGERNSNLPKEVEKIDAKTGEVKFKQNQLAPGSVVRARSRYKYGEWTTMPGIINVDASFRSNRGAASNGGNSGGSANNSQNNNSQNNNKEFDFDSFPEDKDTEFGKYFVKNGAQAANAISPSAKTEADVLKEDDLQNVISVISDPKVDRSTVCGEKSGDTRRNAPSDCVFFSVNVNRKVVQAHPLLLTNPEKSAVRKVLREANSIPIWNDESSSEDSIESEENNVLFARTQQDEDVSNEDNLERLGYNQAKVTWIRSAYLSSANPEDKKPDYKAGNKQDSFVLTRGWRSRKVTPAPRYYHVTRFAALREAKAKNKAGKSIDVKADYEITWDTAKPYVLNRKDDPGFALVGEPGHQSLVYRYNASSKGTIGLGALQNALSFVPVDLKKESKNKSGESLAAVEKAFREKQPTLREIKGTDKEDAESRRNDFKLSDCFTLKDEFTNVPDLVAANGNYGGGNSRQIGYTGNGMSSTVLGDKYAKMAPKPAEFEKWGNKNVYSSAFTIDNALGGVDGIKFVNDTNHSSPRYVLSLSNKYARNSLVDLYGYEAKSDFSDIAGAQSIIPVYVVPVDNVKPEAISKGPLKSSTMDKPYEVTANDIKFTFTGNPDNNGKVNGKELLVDASDDFDSRDVVEKNLQVCVRWMNNNMPQDKDCTPILKRDNSGNASVDADKLQQMLVTHGNTAVYAVYAQTKDKSDNESEHYNAGKDDKKAIIGYVKITGVNVSPVALPFTGGQAAVMYTFMFGVLLALFIASGGFGRSGWLSSVLSASGFGKRSMLRSKHCKS